MENKPEYSSLAENQLTQNSRSTADDNTSETRKHSKANKMFFLLVACGVAALLLWMQRYRSRVIRHRSNEVVIVNVPCITIIAGFKPHTSTRPKAMIGTYEHPPSRTISKSERASAALRQYAGL